MSVDAVVFDIGNVLIEWQPERFFDREIGEKARKALFTEVDLHAMNDRVDRGENFRTVVYETAEAYPHLAEHIRLWHDRWLDIAGPEIPQSIETLHELKAAGVPVYALTNFGVETFEIALPKWPVLNEFDIPFVSGRMKMVKPEPGIYAELERVSGRDPLGLLFADDRVENLEAAAARGWQIHHFTGPEGWRKRLVAEGLLT